MPSTYIDLTNRLLRRVNDVEISSNGFAGARGIQGAAKDFILDTVRKINTSRIDWPFNAVEHTQLLQVGVEEYAWPDQFTAADWNSFQIQKDDTLSIGFKQLYPITREEWYSRSRDKDYDSENVGRGVPIYAFPSHGQGWGITPSPNQAYTLKYRYYKNPTDLVNADDQVTIPAKFDYVIIAGALTHMNLFKENPDGVSIANATYEQGIKDMINLFLPNPSYVYDGRVNFGGSQANSGFYWYKG